MSTKKEKPNYLLLFTLKTLNIFYQSFKETALGIWKRTFDWKYTSIYLSAIIVVYFFDFDIWALSYFPSLKNFPILQHLLFPTYLFLLILPFFYWGFREHKIRLHILRKLSRAFINADLKDKHGRLPFVISDEQVDEHIRCLTLYNQGIPKSEFDAQKNSLQANLGIFIDEIEEDIPDQQIKITYSHLAMPEVVPYHSLEKVGGLSFYIGRSRTSILKSDFNFSPHMLIAGQTGQGKSTFIRQMLANLYRENKDATFKIVDLKGGLEFHYFNGVPRIEVVEELENVIGLLEDVDNEINGRMELIKSLKAKDISSYLKARSKHIENNPKDKDLYPSFGRQFIIIDEAAEIFLGSSSYDAPKAGKVRKLLSRLARLGRASGVHLVIATQRPDVSAVDPQVKSNLTGIICFSMPNLGTSLTTLSNGKANSIPDIKGRAIYRCGNVFSEVQTPYLTVEEALLTMGLDPNKYLIRQSSEDVPETDRSFYDSQ